METEHAPQTPSLEQQTDEQRLAYIRSARRRLRQGVFLALVTLITIFSLCVAWFLNNARVSANAMQLQSGTSGNFELATAGTSGGRFADFLCGLTASAETWASGDLQGTRTSSAANEITWMLDSTSHLSNLDADSGLEPGMRGHLTFYVIPAQSGDLHLRFSLTELLYENDASGTPVAIADTEKAEKLAALIAKHLLFFLLEPVNTGSADTPALATQDEAGEETTGTPAYTATWIEGGTFTLDLLDVEANVPQEVTLYWVWPYLFGQLLIENSDQLLNQPALLGSTITNASALYSALRLDILGTAADAARTIGTDTGTAPDADLDTGTGTGDGDGSSCSAEFLPGYFYAVDGNFSLLLSDSVDGQPLTPDELLARIAQGDTAALASSEYASLNEAYNDADQYLGENLNYLAVRLVAVAN
jgi:hypothetical protein